MRPRHRWAVTLLALLAALAVAGPASAVDPVLQHATAPIGITAPMGVFRDANNDVWVADSHAGICRVLPVGHPAGDGLESTTYCDPTGLLLNRPGPVAPGQSAFVRIDATHAYIYIGDLASASGGVWRLRLDETNPIAVIDQATKIWDVSSLDRVFGMSHFSDGVNRYIEFSTKNSPNILRIADPATCPVYTDPTPCVPSNSGSAEMAATSSLAHDSVGNLYIADLSGVTKITNGSVDTQARPVPGLNLGAYTAVAYDQDNNRVLAGTTNPEGVDWIDIFDIASNATGLYSIGFDGITAIAADQFSTPHTGRLDVIDDPGIKQVGEDLGGTGRYLTVDFEQFVPPPIITSGPQPIINAHTASFFFTNATPTTFFCSLDQVTPTQCGSGPSGTITYNGLTPGAHTFVLSSINATTGPRTLRRFSIDTRAPVVSIDTTTIAGSSVEFGLSVDDLNVDFTCRMDQQLPFVCDDPARFAGVADGLHTFTVFATDLIGNVGPSVSTTFRTGPVPPPPWVPGKITATLRGTSLKIVFNAPPDAKVARFMLSKTNGYKLNKSRKIKSGVKNTVTITLTRGEALRLQRRAVTLKIFAGPNLSTLTTNAGKGTVKVAVRLAATKGR
jgi:hypothetical protein